MWSLTVAQQKHNNLLSHSNSVVCLSSELQLEGAAGAVNPSVAVALWACTAFHAVIHAQSVYGIHVGMSGRKVESK